MLIVPVRSENVDIRGKPPYTCAVTGIPVEHLPAKGARGAQARRSLLFVLSCRGR